MRTPRTPLVLLTVAGAVLLVAGGVVLWWPGAVGFGWYDVPGCPTPSLEGVVLLTSGQGWGLLAAVAGLVLLAAAAGCLVGARLSRGGRAPGSR
ncbi:hypothetical protein ACFEMC_18835 [Kineococcus sp. DHX-1]|uniref:hypothetical protein n=1 Tax=Kineococcus sp. DHX-1 TaxID=3349638 RepID=UPI0036D26225